jgi:hypothetical protein
LQIVDVRANRASSLKKLLNNLNKTKRSRHEQQQTVQHQAVQLQFETNFTHESGAQNIEEPKPNPHRGFGLSRDGRLTRVGGQPSTGGA